jgi:hypothetical protein
MPFTLPPLPVAVLYYLQWWSIPRSWHPCGINHNKEGSMKHMISLVCLLSLSSLVGADNLWSGTWVLSEDVSEGRLTMTVEEVGAGWKPTHEVIGPTAAASTVSIVLTTLDGKEVPVLVNGTSSGQTMKIRKIDSHHTVAIMLLQGKGKSVSKSEISPDGKVLTIETDYTTSNPIGRAGTQIEYWNRQ